MEAYIGVGAATVTRAMDDIARAIEVDSGIGTATIARAMDNITRAMEADDIARAMERIVA